MLYYIQGDIMNNRILEIMELIIKLLISIVLIIIVPKNIYNALYNIELNNFKLCFINNCIFTNIFIIIYKALATFLFICSILFIIILIIYTFKKYICQYIVNKQQIKESKILANISYIIEIVGYGLMPLIMLLVIFIIVISFNTNADLLLKSLSVITGFGLLSFNFFTNFGEYLFYEKKVDALLSVIGFIIILIGLFLL